MKIRILIIRLSTALLLFSGGLLTGWWLRNDLHNQSSGGRVNAVIKPLFNEFQASTPISPPPVFEWPSGYQSGFISEERVDEIQEFLAALDESRFDDALTIYQRHERTGPDHFSRLRTLLLKKLKNWSDQGKVGLCIETLDRFTQSYYQDIELFKILVAVHERTGDFAQAVEAGLSARPFAMEQADIEFFNTNIHRLAKVLFSKNTEQDKLEASLGLFQRLAYLETDFSFFRFALAKSYLALGDIDSAVRELEILQFDQEFGRIASSLLADIFPPLPEEPDEDVPAGTIPLGVSGQHYIAGIRAGDKLEASLLIDTGASLTTLPSRILNELKRTKQAHRVGHVELNTANGLRFSPLFRLKKFQIGEFVLQNLEVAELDSAVGGGADGLLGMNVLSQFMFQIDQDKQMLTLVPR